MIKLNYGTINLENLIYFRNTKTLIIPIFNSILVFQLNYGKKIISVLRNFLDFEMAYLIKDVI